ncbi:response regulator [Candidatus Saccharibacteria bacterium]|nr:response regulator [Candidatus Saccharibacteria bacterium]
MTDVIKQKIAIIEDEAAIRGMYSFKLKHSGFEVCEAGDGIEGLAMLKSELPDLILLDLRMPRMNGDEMLRELRSTDWGESIPVIILTNISRDEAPRTLWHLGVADFIVKSNSTPQKIVDRVESILAELN